MALDAVDADASDDETLVDRVHRLLSSATNANSTPLEECVLRVPAPAMADMLAAMMSNMFGDKRHSYAPTSRGFEAEKWQYTCREGLFVGAVIREWQELNDAQMTMVTINSEISKAFVAKQRASAAYASLKRRHDDAVEMTKPTTRIISHTELESGEFKPVEAIVESRRTPARPPSELKGPMSDAKNALSDATAKLDELEARRANAKATIERIVPQEFAFSLADIASGKVRIRESW